VNLFCSVVGATVLVIPPAVFGSGAHFAEVLAADCLPPITLSFGWGPFGIAPELVPAQAEPTLAEPVAPTFSSVTGFLGVPGSIVFLDAALEPACVLATWRRLGEAPEQSHADYR